MRMSDGRSDVCSSDLHGPTEGCETEAPESVRQCAASEYACSGQCGGRPDVGRAAFLPCLCQHGGAEPDHIQWRGDHHAAALRCGADAGRCCPDTTYSPSRGTHHVSGIIGQSPIGRNRSDEHTSELQSLMRISYAVFCLKKKKKKKN